MFMIKPLSIYKFVFFKTSILKMYQKKQYPSTKTKRVEKRLTKLKSIGPKQTSPKNTDILKQV